MVEINDELIDYLQNLMRVKLSDAERDKTKDDLKKILGYVSLLSDAPTDDTDKFAWGNEDSFRADLPQVSFERADILHNAPRKSDEYFKAPQTIES
ncbi:hypothetical protein AGMMS49975_07180 [Clostridia bacterium]|nr:hypothetical protein AGMMS49975_07180 [Clostridia bacterium]